ncbi:MAG: NAD(P)-dependent glycerol-3-phosphate dehydrogenase [Candidatus Omnitrophica bacterium]|nr:NAD(P)-dependent glycerol-3-phosphate dehydrogenase [Candidatus Omnitrophota bacterium]
MKTIGIIGDGGWGTTLSILLFNKGFRIRVWGPSLEYINFLQTNRENKKFLPQVKIPDEILFTNDIEIILDNVDYLILAVPSQYMRDVLNKIKKHKLRSLNLISATKGIETETLKRMSELITEILGKARLSVISGPSIAFEVARGLPTAIVCASDDSEYMRVIQELLSNERLRVYTNSDVIGVELGGALKNIIAIACGISDGLGFGTNTKAALLCRGLSEIIRLGVKLGAKPETFSGLSGLGDLATTCISLNSRNRWLGEEMAKGRKLNTVLSSTEMVVEGVNATKAAYRLSQINNVDMPITREVYQVLFEEKSPLKAVSDLMTRKSKEELEDFS